MTERDGRADLVVPQEVLTLLEERTKVRGWLEKLQQFRREASSPVFERVQADYRGRLEAVNARLTEHRADLESSVARHRGRVEELQGDRDEKAAALEEAELRFRVGEYPQSEWDRRRSEAERAIQGLDAELKEERGALAELEKVLGDLVSERRAEPVGPREEVGTEVAEPEARPGWGPGPEREAAEREAAPSWPAALARGDAAVGGAAETVPSGREGPATPETGRGPVRPAGADEVVEEEEGEYVDELEFLESLSLEEAGRFDAVSLMLDETEEGEEEGKEGGEGSP